MSSTYFITTVNNQSIGVQPNPNLINKAAVVGTCTGVPAGAKLDVSQQNISSAGCGPAANMALLLLSSGISLVSIYGAAPLSSEALSATSLTPHRASGTPSTGTITAAGTPCDSFLLRIVCTISGATNTAATFQYYLDDGISPVETVTGAASYLLKARTGSPSASSGVTITLAVGTYNAGDVFNLAIFAPQIDTTDADVGSLASFLQLIENSGNYNFIVIANTPNFGVLDATNFSSMQAMLAKVVSDAAALDALNVKTQWVTNAPRPVALGVETGATFLANFSTLTSQSDRMWVGAGYALQNSNGSYLAWMPVSGLIVQRELANNNPRLSIFEMNPVGVIAPGRLDSAIGNTLLDYSGLLQYGTDFDERLTVSNADGALTPLGFAVLETNRLGPEPIESTFYFKGGNIKTSNTSDFFEGQRSVLTDVFLTVVYKALMKFKGKSFFSNTSSKKPVGSIRDEDANSIEDSVDREVQTQLVDPKFIAPHGANQKFVIVDRTNNFAASETINFTYGFSAPGWVKKFVGQFAFQIGG